MMEEIESSPQNPRAIESQLKIDAQCTQMVSIPKSSRSIQSIQFSYIMNLYIGIGFLCHRFLIGTEILGKRGLSIMMTRGRFCQQMLSWLDILWVALWQGPQLYIQNSDPGAFGLLSLYPAPTGVLSRFWQSDILILWIHFHLPSSALHHMWCWHEGSNVLNLRTS